MSSWCRTRGCRIYEEKDLVVSISRNRGGREPFSPKDDLHSLPLSFSLNNFPFIINNSLILHNAFVGRFVDKKNVFSSGRMMHSIMEILKRNCPSCYPHDSHSRKMAIILLEIATSKVLVADDDFSIRFYNIVAGIPAVDPFIVLTNLNVQRTPTGKSITTYAYSVDIDPITLLPDTPYLLSIVNNTVNDPDLWSWSLGQVCHQEYSRGTG